MLASAQNTYIDDDPPLFFMILDAYNQSKQLDNYIVINSTPPVKEILFKIKDLQSRINSFIFIGIDLPTDNLLKVILTKKLRFLQVVEVKTKVRGKSD